MRSLSRNGGLNRRAIAGFRNAGFRNARLGRFYQTVVVIMPARIARLHREGLLLTRRVAVIAAIVAALVRPLGAELGALLLPGFIALIVTLIVARFGPLVVAVFVAVVGALIVAGFLPIPIPIAVIALRVLAILAVALIAILAVVASLATIRVAVLVIILPALLAVLHLPGLLFGGHLTCGLAKKAGVMLGVLQEILAGHAVVGQLRIARQLLIFLDDLLRRAAHLAFGAGAVEDTVDDIAEGARAVRFRTRTGLGRAHLVL